MEYFLVILARAERTTTKLFFFQPADDKPNGLKDTLERFAYTLILDLFESVHVVTQTYST